MTIGRSLKFVLLGQAVLAVLLVVADIDARWLPRFAGERTLPTGPVSPGDQVRPYDPARTAPGFTDRPAPPGIDLPADMPARMQFETVPVAGIGDALLLNGPVTPGDADRLAAHLASLAAPPEAIALNSPGGVVAEALAMGRQIRQAGADTVMLPGMFCLSSCPYILAAGDARRVSRGAAVGMHQHYYDAPGFMPVFLAVEGIQHGQGLTMEYLIEMGVDPALMRHSLNTPPEEIYLLVEEELRETRLATEMTD
ncbi:hypothetical protein HMH01_15280 [Halovulum dunhuangense]|uniref:Uncharacterized protein n=1 Tax=Halovulum dunhuangense TaxID=1505036 RepID=A0A849L5P7_9RHOB|nr:hypothetical protein [Halovulum dunhuangense]NNU81798.1 hypothetical protein [Halovulum dunhuangense]